MNIHHLLKGLAQDRPIFHSEADFQHALAWQIHETIPDSQVRLEYPFALGGNRKLDIWLQGKKVAIELKYFTKCLEVRHCGENFHLKNQSAMDRTRWLFFEDVKKLEHVVAHRYGCVAGFAILLTNDSRLWEPPRVNRKTKDRNFRIHEGRTSKGKLEWIDKGKVAPEYTVCLTGCYTMRWEDYSSLAGGNGEFRYLVVRVQ